jgi:hypothetical protein
MQKLELKINELRNIAPIAETPLDEPELSSAVKNTANAIYDISDRIYSELRASREQFILTPARVETSERDSYAAKAMT